MDRKRLLQLLILLALLVSTVAVSAEVYRWVDENGRAHYGDRPPADVEQSDEVKIHDQKLSSEPVNVDRKQAQQRLLEQYRREREMKKKQADKELQERQERKKRCASAKSTLAQYQHSILYDRFPDQEPRFLTTEEQQAEIAKVRKEVEKWCE